MLVAQIGARRHYAVPRALYHGGMLEVFVTDACGDLAPWKWLGQLSPSSAQPASLKRLLNRRLRDIPAERVVGLPWFVLGVGKLGRRWRTDWWTDRNEDFCKRVVRHGFGEAGTVYAFNGAALEIFEAVRARELGTVLDQTAAPWRWNRSMLQAEVRDWPGWEDEPAELDVSGRLLEREEAEWRLADAIVCGSEFCRDALLEAGVDARKCHVIPTTFLGSVFAADDETMPNNQHRGELRVLFAGTLQLRKGIQYLYEAAKQLGGEPVRIRAVGPSMLSEAANARLAEHIELKGAIPRADMEEHYRWADVLVLPTLSEGSANVCHEAMAAGVPVITTREAGSIVRDGVEGMIIPSRDSEALADAIRSMVWDREMVQRQGRMASARVRRARCAAKYAEQLCSLVEDLASATYEH